MSETNQGRALEILMEAVGKPHDQRAAFVQKACAGDDALLAEVRSLLDSHDRAGDFLASPTAGACPEKSEGSNGAVREAPGAMIGPYKLLQLIGEGGFGSVFLAEQERPVRRKVALKIIKLGMDTEQVIARFEAERQALAMMDHPHIAKVLDAGATDTGRPYFVMELVRGVPITDYCDTNNLPLPDRLALFVQVCHAVQHAHAKGIIHRDLKPSNVMVTMSDGRPAPKVIDFGIAKATDHRLTEKTIFTQFREMIGTPQYMSPEQAEMAGIDIDTRSDIYSLGVLLYELLVGSTPFDPEELRSKAYAEMQRMIREVDPQRPSTRLSSVGGTLATIAARRRIEPAKLGQVLKGELDWIVMRAMEKDRTRRYETANGLAMDVQRHLDNEPVLARPPSTTYRLGKLAHKHRTAVVGTAAVAAALLLAVIGTSIGLARARTALYASRIAEADALNQKQVATRLLQDVTTARAAAEGQSRRARAANDFMRNMLSSAQPGAGGGNGDVKVSEVLDRAAAHLDTLKDQPELEMDGRLVLADTYQSLNHYDKALVNYNRSLELSRAMTGPESEQTLQITADLLLVPGPLTNEESPEPMAREAVATARRVLGPRHPLTLDMLNSLGVILQHSKDNAAAEQIFRDLTSRIHESGYVPPPKGSARFFNNLATAVNAQGRVAEAEQLQRQAIDVARREMRDDPKTTGLMLTNLAHALYAEGKYPESEKAYREALAYERTALGASHPETLNTMSLLADLLEQRGSFAEAVPFLHELVNLDPQKSESGYGIRLAELGELQLRSGREAEAASTFSQAMKCLWKVPQASFYDLKSPQAVWTLVNVLQGLRADRTWTGSAIHAQAEWTAWSAVSAHSWGHPPLDAVEWPKLHFKVRRWSGRGSSDGAAIGSDVVAEGGLADLWVTPDPKPGLYLFCISVPRRNATTLREAQWMFVAPWKLSVFPATPDQVRDRQKWTALVASQAAEYRSAAALSQNRCTMLNRAIGPSDRRDGFAVVASVVQSLPQGEYRLKVVADVPYRVIRNGQTVQDGWLPGLSVLQDVTLIGSSGNPPDELRVEAAFVNVHRYWLGNMLGLTLVPLHKDADAMTAAEQGLSLVQGDLEQLDDRVARGETSAKMFHERGFLLTRCGRFAEALADFDKSIQLNPSDHWPWYRRGCILAYQGNADAHRANCKGMLERFATSSNWAVVDRTIKSCLLSPAPEEPKRLAEMAQRYLAETKRTDKVGNAELCRSMACYRLGDYSGCLESAQASAIPFSGEGISYQAAAGSLIAMAQEHLNRHDEAIATLQRARTLVDQLPQPGQDDLSVIGYPENWLVGMTLFHEAQGVVGSARPATQPRPPAADGNN